MSKEWNVWQPSREALWDVRRVIHLHRRAGFAPTWREIQRDLKDGPERSIDRLLAGQSRLQGVPPDFDEMSALIGSAVLRPHGPDRLKAWWMYRLLFSPDPLGEKLTLLWHDHFATSNAKVNDVVGMRHQNETLRQHARAPFGEMLRAVLHDPAMLDWLDAPANKKGSPNENLARELMELFTLGIDNYSEDDVKQSARALTGWTVKNGQHAFVVEEHDAGKKTILGRTGAWTANDLATILLQHPAASRRLAWRICGLLMGESVASDEAIDALAAGLRQQDLNIGWGVETVLRSELFFAEQNIGTKIASPVEFIINSVRALEAFDPPPSTVMLSKWSANMGQNLFYPPNVGGWAGGRGWLGARFVVSRANFASALVEGKLKRSAVPPDLHELAGRHTGAEDLETCVAFVTELLHGLTEPQTELLRTVKQRAKKESQLKLAVGIMMSRPDAWLL
jgi:uncharacterized protein (DUF1800 family)